MRRLNRQRSPEQRLRFRKKTTLAHEMLAELGQLLPPGCRVYVLFDSWYGSNRLLKFCRRQHWYVVCAIKSNRKLDDQQFAQWPQALKHQRYQRVQLTATDQRRGPPWCVRSRANSTACRLTSVCSSVNGTLGTNTRSIFCAPTSRERHSKS